jgi:hypothetical protein
MTTLTLSLAPCRPEVAGLLSVARRHLRAADYWWWKGDVGRWKWHRDKARKLASRAERTAR